MTTEKNVLPVFKKENYFIKANIFFPPIELMVLL